MLSNHIQQTLSVLPASIQPLVEQHWQRYLAACDAAACPIIDEHYVEPLCQVWAGSDFVANWCVANPQQFQLFMLNDDWQHALSADDQRSCIQQALTEVTDEASLMKTLRDYRNREMVRIAWRDLTGLAVLESVLAELSALADALITVSLQQLYRWQSEEFATPKTASGESQELLIVTLGKLGGRALNFSSDVDLMFAYPEEEVAGSITSQVFFTRLAQRLIKVLHSVTGEGMVYRVDMRLRPFGDNGPLVMNFAGLAAYYQEQGRNWERYALLKARIISGKAHDIERLQNLLQPFVYRRYIDFGAIESMRQMKLLFAREARLKTSDDNIKRGEGGIRQIEFISQVFQLIRGGQERQLQRVAMLPILRYLADSGTLAINDVQQLIEAYCFLRRLEHRLQMVNDQQTHRLPQDDLLQTRIAYAMGFDDWSTMTAELQQHRLNVTQQFTQIMTPPSDKTPPYDKQKLVVLRALWQERTLPEKALQTINSELDWPAIQDILQQFRQSYRYRQLNDVVRAQLDTLLPLLLRAIAKVDNPQQTLVRITDLLEAIMRRSAYIVLLLENPIVIERLIQVCSASRMMAELITHFPVLLDELLSSQERVLPATRQSLQSELRQSLLAVVEDNVEQQMEILRRFKHRQHLRVAMADVLQQLPLMKVSDHLTFTAEVLLQQSQVLASKLLANKIGELSSLAIVAYGKLGGIELSYHSDLDLVFLYDKTDANERDMIRLVQKILHLLSTRTASGILYQVDTRLRPSGSAGLLVSTFKAFAEYQQQNAWTWEHQALVRARVVSGDQTLYERFSQIRQQVLARQRPLENLQKEVSDMRDKMRAHHSSSSPTMNIKYVDGGITDIEFIVQYGVLAWAWQHPELLRWTDNIRILESFATANLMTNSDVELLCRAYQVYRDVIHQQLLHGATEEQAAAAIESYAQAVTEIWQRVVA